MKTVYHNDEISLALIQQDITYIKSNVSDMNKKLDSNYVTKDQLAPLADKVQLLQKIVYGVVTLILTAVVLGLISLLFSSRGMLLK